MLRLLVAATVTVAAAVLSASAGPPATAAGTGQPVILTPAAETVREWDGGWSVALADAPAGEYTVLVDVTGQNRRYYDLTTETGAEPVVHEGTRREGAYADGEVTVSVTRGETTLDSVTFHVTGWAVPELVTPAPDTTTDDWDGAVTIDLTGARSGDWYVRVRDPDTAYDETRRFTREAGTTDDLVGLDFPRPDRSGTITVTIRTTDPERTWRTSSFADVVAGVSRLRPHPAEFHPLVRDGDRDRVRLTYRLAEPAGTRLVVRDDRGRRVWVDDLGRQRAGRNATAWDGRVTAGGRAAPGRYTVAVLTGAGTDHVRSDTTHVAVRRG